jgi:hypothetical protein
MLSKTSELWSNRLVNSLMRTVGGCRLVGIAAACLLFSLSGWGCSAGPNNAPVVASQARDALRTALESWKKGEKVDELQDATPPIYVIDQEWKDGATLKDYQITGAGDEKDAHLFAPVKLTVRQPGGREVRKDVIYIISTAPNITVSRKVF